MLEDFGIFLVLADKVWLYAWCSSGDSLLTQLAVVVCVPHRGPGAIVASKRTHLTDASEAQREQGCPFLQRWQLERAHSRHLHEEERSESHSSVLKLMCLTELSEVGQCFPCSGTSCGQNQ